MSDQEGVLPVDVDPFGIKNINTKKRNSQPNLFGASDNQSDKEKKKQTRPQSLTLLSNGNSTQKKESLTPDHKSSIVPSEEPNKKAPLLTQEENSLRSSQTSNHQILREIMTTSGTDFNSNNESGEKKEITPSKSQRRRQSKKQNNGLKIAYKTFLEQFGLEDEPQSLKSAEASSDTTSNLDTDDTENGSAIKGPPTFPPSDDLLAHSAKGKPEIMKPQEEAETKSGNNDNPPKQRSNSTATDVEVEDENENGQGHRSGSDTDVETAASKVKSRQTPPRSPTTITVNSPAARVTPPGSNLHTLAKRDSDKTSPTISPLPQLTEIKSGGEPTPQERETSTNTGSQEGGENLNAATSKTPPIPQPIIGGPNLLPRATAKVNPLSPPGAASDQLTTGDGEKKIEPHKAGGDHSLTKEEKENRQLGEGLSDPPAPKPGSQPETAAGTGTDEKPTEDKKKEQEVVLPKHTYQTAVTNLQKQITDGRTVVANFFQKQKELRREEEKDDKWSFLRHSVWDDALKRDATKTVTPEDIIWQAQLKPTDDKGKGGNRSARTLWHKVDIYVNKGIDTNKQLISGESKERARWIVALENVDLEKGIINGEIGKDTKSWNGIAKKDLRLADIIKHKRKNPATSGSTILGIDVIKPASEVNKAGQATFSKEEQLIYNTMLLLDTEAELENAVVAKHKAKLAEDSKRCFGGRTGFDDKNTTDLTSTISYSTKYKITRFLGYFGILKSGNRTYDSFMGVVNDQKLADDRFDPRYDSRNAKEIKDALVQEKVLKMKL